MTNAWESSIAEMLAAISEVADGNLRIRVPAAEDSPEPLKALAEGTNRLISAWRTSELRARKTKRALEEKVATVEAQAVAIRELSTPIMQIWRDVLLLPLVGGIDETRSAEITYELLDRVVKTRSSRVIVDITGVEQVDESTADHLLRLVRATKLVGARCVLTGMSPAVAQTLTGIGADLRELRTMRTLELGLLDCMADKAE